MSKGFCAKGSAFCRRSKKDSPENYRTMFGGKILNYFQSILIFFSTITPLINFFSAVAPWIVIVFLLLERREKARPYLHVSFEPVRSTLACVVIRNTSSTPATLNFLSFNEDFLKQLKQETQLKLKNFEKTTMTIFPGKLFVISFDVNVFDILKDFENKIVSIDITYSKLNSKKYYSENIAIDFEDYSGILVYLSELDEFKQVTDKLASNIKGIKVQLEKITTFKDDWEKYIACSLVCKKDEGENA